MADEVFPWLKSLPLAPEYHPTLIEFQDPISYIFKIEEEASKYGICKIVPPVSASPKKTIIANLNRSLSARNPDSSPTFTTRRQQIGFCPRKHRQPVRKSVWQSGETYTLPQFEAKANNFKKNYLKKKRSNSKKGLTELEVETLYWKAHMGKPFLIEYANDIPGSAFHQTGGGRGGKKQGKKEIGDALTVGETEWNTRGVSRAKGCLLKFVKGEIPGVTSPMVYMAMMFSWFAWHVEDHDLHSLNYMHMGAGKTWYGVPKDAAVAFEDVIRAHGYGGEMNPIVTFATLGEKTTIMSPDVLLKAGVPCCRLVQNAGEFVVTFPRAYHSGFSHGFNCAEATNIATPGWLRVARDAAIRRASTNCAPIVSHSQLLYDLAVSLSASVPTSIKHEPQSSRLKERLKVEEEFLVKRLFLQDMMQNNKLLHTLKKGSSVVLLSENDLDNLTSKDSCFQSQLNASSMFSLNLCIQNDEMKSLASNSIVLDRGPIRRKYSSFGGSRDEALYSLTYDDERNKKPNLGLFSCVTCGILCYTSIAIIQPTEAAARYLMSADCEGITDQAANTNFFTANEDANLVDPKSSSGEMLKSGLEGMFDVPIRSDDQIQDVDGSMNTTAATGPSKVSSSLDLLALAYGDPSDSEEEKDVERNIRLNYSSNVPLNINDDDDTITNSNGDHFNARVAIGESSYQTPSSVRSKCNKFFTESNCSMGQFEYHIKVPHSERKPLLNAKEFEALIIGKVRTPVGNKPINPIRDEDTSRMHIFCLQHAAEVEQRFQLIGGVHMLLLCHQDYPKLEAEARLMEKEFGTNHIWTDLKFREASKQDEKRIRLALDDEEAIHGNHDWAVRLGLDLFYSARLSRSSLYSKQMPYNLVIYKAFGNGSPSSDPTKSKPLGKHKEIIIAGKWCGKVWMSNQVHPFLVVRDVEDQEHDETEVSDFSRMDVKLEKQPQITQVVVSKNLRKRKRKNVTICKPIKFPFVESSTPPPPPPPSPLEDLPSSSGFKQQHTTNLKNKQIIKETNPNPRTVLDKKSKQFCANFEDERNNGLRKSLRKRIIKPPNKEIGVQIESNQKVKPHNETKKAVESDDGELGCDIDGCNLSFDSRRDLMAHKKNVCPVKGCGKKFFSHKYLMQHKRVHMDDRPLKCPWKGCQMTFKWAWARTEHIRVHTGVRPYTCTTEGCGQTFRFISDFSRHKRKTGHSVKK